MLTAFLATLTAVVRDSKLTAGRAKIVFEVPLGDELMEYAATDINAAPGQVRVRLRRIVR